MVAVLQGALSLPISLSLPQQGWFWDAALCGRVLRAWCSGATGLHGTVKGETQPRVSWLTGFVSKRSCTAL